MRAFGERCFFYVDASETVNSVFTELYEDVSDPQTKPEII